MDCLLPCVMDMGPVFPWTLPPGASITVKNAFIDVGGPDAQQVVRQHSVPDIRVLEHGQDDLSKHDPATARFFDAVGCSGNSGKECQNQRLHYMKTNTCGHEKLPKNCQFQGATSGSFAGMDTLLALLDSLPPWTPPLGRRITVQKTFLNYR